MQVRYTINDQRCVFPATLSNGTVVYDCFSVPSLTDTSSEASSATGQQYCLVTESANSQPVQCAAPGYRPESVDAPANLVRTFSLCALVCLLVGGIVHNGRMKALTPLNLLTKHTSH